MQYTGCHLKVQWKCIRVLKVNLISFVEIKSPLAILHAPGLERLNKVGQTVCTH